MNLKCINGLIIMAMTHVQSGITLQTQFNFVFSYTPSLFVNGTL